MQKFWDTLDIHSFVLGSELATQGAQGPKVSLTLAVFLGYVSARKDCCGYIMVQAVDSREW